MQPTDVVDALGALAQETRLEVYRLLVRAGPSGLAAGRIASELGVPAATLSFHLKELVRAGLLHRQRRGRSIVYAPDFGQMNELLAYLTENCCSAAPGDCAPRVG